MATEAYRKVICMVDRAVNDAGVLLQRLQAREPEKQLDDNKGSTYGLPSTTQENVQHWSINLKISISETRVEIGEKSESCKTAPSYSTSTSHSAHTPPHSKYDQISSLICYSEYRTNDKTNILLQLVQQKGKIAKFLDCLESDTKNLRSDQPKHCKMFARMKWTREHLIAKTWVIRLSRTGRAVHLNVWVEPITSRAAHLSLCATTGTFTSPVKGNLLALHRLQLWMQFTFMLEDRGLQEDRRQKHYLFLGYTTIIAQTWCGFVVRPRLEHSPVHSKMETPTTHI